MRSVIITLFASFLAVQSLTIEDCHNVQAKTKEIHKILIPACFAEFGVKPKWAGPISKDGIVGGGCQSDKYCGYQSPSRCNSDGQCVWNRRRRRCMVFSDVETERRQLEEPSTSPSQQPSTAPSNTESVLAREIDPAELANPDVITYVPMLPQDQRRYITLVVEGKNVPEDQLLSVGNGVKGFYQTMARGRVRMTTLVGNHPAGGRDKMLLIYIPGAWSHVPIIGNAVSAHHELGHEFSLGHAQSRIWKTQEEIQLSKVESDPFDPMTFRPDQPSLNAAHLHYLGWFTATEEAYAKVGGTYTLYLINGANSDWTTLKSLYYQVPNTDRAFWFSYVKIDAKDQTSIFADPPGMPGTAIAVHSVPGPSSGMTYLEELIGTVPSTNIRSGLIIEVSNATATTVVVTVKKDPTWVPIGDA